MAIKAVDEIPLNIVEKRKSYREMIQNDIAQAINDRVPKFEFEGDYNWKYLHQYAREEARRLQRRMIYPYKREVGKELGKKYGRKYIVCPNRFEYGDWLIKIHSHKGKDRRHVYAEIDFDTLDNLKTILLKEMEEAELAFIEREKAREEARRKP